MLVGELGCRRQRSFTACKLRGLREPFFTRLFTILYPPATCGRWPGGTLKTENVFPWGVHGKITAVCGGLNRNESICRKITKE